MFKVTCGPRAYKDTCSKLKYVCFFLSTQIKVKDIYFFPAYETKMCVYLCACAITDSVTAGQIAQGQHCICAALYVRLHCQHLLIIITSHVRASIFGYPFECQQQYLYVYSWVCMHVCVCVCVQFLSTPCEQQQLGRRALCSTLSTFSPSKMKVYWWINEPADSQLKSSGLFGSWYCIFLCVW